MKKKQSKGNEKPHSSRLSVFVTKLKEGVLKTVDGSEFVKKGNFIRTSELEG